MEDFFSFDKKNIKEKLKQISYLKQDIIKQIKSKTKELIELEDKRDKRWQELYVYYLTDYNIKLTSSEVKQFVEKDKEILELNKQIKLIQNDIKTLENTLKNLDTMQWNIKTYIEWIKLENGII